MANGNPTIPNEYKVTHAPELEKNYANAETNYAKALIAYGKSADKKLYYESTYTNQVKQADAEAAFRAGLLMVKVGNDFYAPVKMTNNAVTIIGTGSVSSTSVLTPENYTCVATA